MPIPSPLGLRVRYARHLVPELSARELGRLADTHVGLIESGAAANVTMSTLAKVATAIGASLSWLVSGDGAAPTASEVLTAVTAAREALAAREAETK